MRRSLTLGLLFALCSALTTAAGAKKDDSTAQFEKRAEAYVAARKSAGKKIRKPGDKASPEAIAEYKARLRELVRASRPDAKPGDVLGAGIFEIVAAVRSETAGPEDREAAKTIAEDGNPAAEGKAFAPKVNSRYPEDAPRSTVPPDLLAKLPPLPETLEYRFVGRTLILYDAEADLIVDYATGVVKGNTKP
jgi:hypothetical protein